MGSTLFNLPEPYGLILIILVVVISLALRLAPLFSSDKHAARIVRQYGLGGGAVCPGCGRPFAISVWSLKLGLGQRFTRCPHCRRWSLVRLSSPAELAAAEAAFAPAQPAAPAKSEAEKTADLIDDSRFTNLP